VADDKITYIETNEHAMVAGSAPLAPGGRILFDEENAAHKQLQKLIKAEDESVSHLSIVEVSPKDEKKAAEELQEKLEEGDKIAAAARDEQLQAEIERLEGTGDDKGLEGETRVPQVQDATPPPQDVESQRLAEQSGPGQRATTQEDVVEENPSPKQGRRSARSK
jgi:hypothetical protein